MTMDPRRCSRPLGRASFVGWSVAVFAAWALLPGCGEESDPDPANPRSCGNGACEASQCETMARCPDDCGICVGASCTPTAATGTCGEICTSSCGCLPDAEVCTADYGFSPGVCVPVGCIACMTSCQYAPDGNGVCATATCP